MATNLAGVTLGLKSLFASVVPGNVSVRTGWQWVETGRVLTVGLPDPALTTEDPLTQPAAGFGRVIMGGTHSHDTETVRVFCSLDVPPEGDEDPDSVVQAASDILGLCAQAVIDNPPAGLSRCFVSEALLFVVGSLPSGFGAAGTFTVVAESYV